jgi:hypothetical protein
MTISHLKNNQFGFCHSPPLSVTLFMKSAQLAHCPLTLFSHAIAPPPPPLSMHSASSPSYLPSSRIARTSVSLHDQGSFHRPSPLPLLPATPPPSPSPRPLSVTFLAVASLEHVPTSTHKVRPIGQACSAVLTGVGVAERGYKSKEGYLVYGIWYYGIRAAYGIRHMIYGMWYTVCGVWYTVHGIWHTVYVTWYTVHVIWYSVHRTWYTVHGIW